MTRSVEPEKNAEGDHEELRPEGADGSIWDVIDDIMRGVPEEVLKRLPADGAEQHDHHLYGSPRKAPRAS